MNDGETIELDEETFDNLDELAKEAGLSNDEYLRKVLFDRANAHLKQQQPERSLFLP